MTRRVVSAAAVIFACLFACAPETTAQLDQWGTWAGRGAPVVPPGYERFITRRGLT